MADHDYAIANDVGSAVRADLNALFLEIQNCNSKSTAPSQAVAGKLWFDSATSTMKYYTGSEWKPVSSTGKMIAMSMIFG